MYTDEGKLEFDEDEMAALEGQLLVAELFSDFESEPDFEGFHAISWQEISVAEMTVGDIISTYPFDKNLGGQPRIQVAGKYWEAIK